MLRWAIIMGIMYTAASCKPLDASSIVDIQSTSEICESECSAVWNATASEENCLLWSDKAWWWAGNACVARCEDLDGYSANGTRDLFNRLSKARCITPKGVALNHYAGKGTVSELNSVPIWCACYDLYRFIRYTDASFCKYAGGVLVGAQILFVAVGGISICFSVYLLFTSQWLTEEDWERPTHYANVAVFGLLAIVLSFIGMYLLPCIIMIVVVLAIVYCLCGESLKYMPINPHI
jgi:hypothetical protein